MKKIIAILIILIISVAGTSCNQTKNLEEATGNTSNLNSEINKSEEKFQEVTDSKLDEEKQLKETKAIEHIIKIREENYNLDKLINIKKINILDEDELGILRNAIYAKHGYKFKTSKYNEYFSKTEWYIPKLSDVGDMLTDIDIQNISNIVEKENEIKESKIPLKVFEVVKQVENKNYLYKGEFYLVKNLVISDDVVFNQFLIYKIQDDNKVLVFDSRDYSDLLDEDALGVSSNTDWVFRIDDKDGDGVEEMYIDLQTFFGDPTTLIINNSNNEYYVAFYDVLSGDPRYIDVDEDGIKELISDHGGGGGWVSTWEGLGLVNKMEGQRYVFSYDLTKMYHERFKDANELSFSADPTPGNFASLLNAYADLGMPQKCEVLIEKYPELVNSKFDYSTYYDSNISAYVDFFDHVVGRAYVYEQEWISMKNWNN